MLNFVLISIVAESKFVDVAHVESDLLTTERERREVGFTFVKNHGYGKVVVFCEGVGYVDACIDACSRVELAVRHTLMIALAEGLFLAIEVALEERPLREGEKSVDRFLNDGAGTLIVFRCQAVCRVRRAASDRFSCRS